MEPESDNGNIKNKQNNDQPMEKQIVKTHTKRQNFRPPSNDTTMIDVGSMSPEEIELKIKELYEKVDGVWRCLACDYSSTIHGSAVKRHIETHLEGLSYTCPLCNMEFRSRSILVNHKNNVNIFF